MHWYFIFVTEKYCIIWIYTNTFYLFIYQSVDIWVVDTFLTFVNNAAMCIRVQVFV